MTVKAKLGNPNWYKGMASPNPYGAGGFPKLPKYKARNSKMGYGVKNYKVSSQKVTKKKGNNPYGRNGKPQFFDHVAKGAEAFLSSPFTK